MCKFSPWEGNLQSILRYRSTVIDADYIIFLPAHPTIGESCPSLSSDRMFSYDTNLPSQCTPMAYIWLQGQRIVTIDYDNGSHPFLRQYPRLYTRRKMHTRMLNGDILIYLLEAGSRVRHWLGMRLAHRVFCHVHQDLQLSLLKQVRFLEGVIGGRAPVSVCIARYHYLLSIIYIPGGVKNRRWRFSSSLVPNFQG